MFSGYKKGGFKPGSASFRSMCSPRMGDLVAMVDYDWSNVKKAMAAAHAIETQLGMRKDYTQVFNHQSFRKSSDGKTCKNTIMDDAKWFGFSQCSIEDFDEFY